MNITLGQIIVWLIIGGFSGALVGLTFRRKKNIVGRAVNFGIGLVGALLGGLLFRLLNIDFGLGSLTISFEDLIAGFSGSLLFLAIVTVWQWRRKAQQGVKTDNGSNKKAA